MTNQLNIPSNRKEKILWDSWDRKHLFAVIDRDLSLIEKCIQKKKELTDSIHPRDDYKG